MPLHTIPPVYDKSSRVLILGSFPSVKSREAEFFYAHPQNRFWRVLAAVFGCPVPEGTAEKRTFLFKNHIALWDVIASCEITGSSDSSIKNAVSNDISVILNSADITKIFVNGRTAEKLYKRFLLDKTGQEAYFLPSTSPANAAWSIDALVGEWKSVAEGINANKSPRNNY